MDSKTLSKQRYSEYADGYVTSITHSKGEELQKLVDIANPQADWHILDIATGGGHTALAFAPHVARVTATDLTPTMLDKAREFILSKGIANAEFKVADAENLPFEDEKFDLVTCRIAPHHFPDVARFVLESARVLKAGGMLLVQDHVLPNDSETASVVDGFEKLRDPSHNHAFSRTEWIALFEDAELEIVHTEQIIKRHEFVDWAARQGCDDETIAELVNIVEAGSDSVKAWMQPEHWHTPAASFVNHHIIIAGRKPSA